MDDRPDSSGEKRLNLRGENDIMSVTPLLHPFAENMFTLSILDVSLNHSTHTSYTHLIRVSRIDKVPSRIEEIIQILFTLLLIQFTAHHT